MRHPEVVTDIDAPATVVWRRLEWLGRASRR
jgi:hypothetical protein